MPYPIFAFCALLPWQLFAYALTQSSNSLVDNRQMLTKVYFPRLILPLASVLAGLVDFAIAFVVLVGMMLVLRHRPRVGHADAASVHPAGGGGGAGGRALAVGA